MGLFKPWYLNFVTVVEWAFYPTNILLISVTRGTFYPVLHFLLLSLIRVDKREEVRNTAICLYVLGGFPSITFERTKNLRLITLYKRRVTLAGLACKYVFYFCFIMNILIFFTWIDDLECWCDVIWNMLLKNFKSWQGFDGIRSCRHPIPFFSITLYSH